MRKMIWLIDNSLRDHIGHYFTFAASLYRHAAEQGLSLRILGNEHVTDKVRNEVPVEPVFRYDFHAPFRSKFWKKLGVPNVYYDFLKANLEFYRDLRRALRSGVNRDSILFMPMANHRQLLAWAWWLRWRRPKSAPMVVLMFRLNYFDIGDPDRGGPSQRLAKLSFRILEMLARGRRVRIVTDSERLRREYSLLTRLPVEIFPIPHTGDIARAVSPNGSHLGNGFLRFVTLGDAREEKGLPLLMNAIRLLRDQGALQDIRFALHCYIGSEYHVGMLQYRRALEEMELPNLELIVEPFDTEGYIEFLKSADIVLLPYSRRVYYARTSGPLTEALAAGKPVIVPEDTWMSDQIRRFGAGVTFRDGSAEDLARAIMRACSLYAELATRARANQSAWLAVHNPSSFFKALLCETETVI